MGCNSYEVDIRRNPYTKVPGDVKKAVKEAMNVEWELNQDTMSVMRELGADKVKEILGWQSTDGLQVSYDALESVKSRNRAIEKSVDELFALDETVQERISEGNSTGFYFDWFVAKNNRMMIDSAGVNPQSDKLHRFVMNTKKQESTISKADERSMNVFRMAVAQAAGYGIDKKASDKIYQMADKVLGIQDFSKKLTKKLKTAKPDASGKVELVIDGVHMEVEHLSHLILMAKEVDNFNKSGDVFTTRLTLEADALTSGFGLKLLQMPIIEKAKEWLSKTGIIIQDGTEYQGITDDGMNDIQDKDAKTGFEDSYRTLAKAMGTDQDVLDAYRAELEQLEREDVDVVIEQVAALQKLLPPIVKDGVVTSEGRSLFKGPFMTFNYGAGWAKIKKELAYSMMDGVVQQILDYKLGKTTSDDVKNVIEKLGIEKITAEELMTTELGKLKNSNGQKLDKLLEGLLGNSYGSKVQQVMDEEFRSIVVANGTINDALRVMFKVFDKLYTGELDKMAKEEGRVPTIEDEMAVFKKFRKVFPIMDSPLGDSIEEGIAIFSTAMATDRAGRQPGTELKTGFRGTTVIRRYLEEAGASGSVIPIHTLDASIMAKTMIGRDILEVHDAIVMGIGQVDDTVVEYNKNLVELENSWSMVDATRDAYLRLFETAEKNEEVWKALDEVITEESEKDENDRSRVEVKELVGVISRLADNTRISREAIFQNPIKVQNMVFDKNTAYEFNKGKEPKPVTLRNFVADGIVEETKAESKQDVSKMSVNELIEAALECKE